jgi:hypothetical protein
VTRPSEYLANSLRREFSPAPDEEASQFYRRGAKYNAIGGLKGTHAFAFVWAVCIVLPLFIIAKVAEFAWNAAMGRKHPGGVEGA